MSTTLEIRPIPGYEGRYSARSDGAIISHPKNGLKGDRFLKQNHNDKGYLMVSVSVPGCKFERKRAHRLVCQAFHGLAPQSDFQVNHINGIKDDNRVENLEWCTPSKNLYHAYDTGLKTAPRGSIHCRAKLDERDVSAIRRLWSLGQKARVIADAYGVTVRNICNICCRKIWRHVA
jgi:hypothetical protein